LVWFGLMISFGEMKDESGIPKPIMKWLQNCWSVLPNKQLP
jgi:hypothetical protein